MHLNVLPKMWLIFCCRQQKGQENKTHFEILMTITPGVSMITRKIILFFFHLLFKLVLLVYFILHFTTFKIQFYGVPSLCCVLVCTIHIYMPKMTLSTWIFFYMKFVHFWYLTCSFPNLILIWPQSHGLSWFYGIENFIITFFSTLPIP